MLRGGRGAGESSLLAYFGLQSFSFSASIITSVRQPSRPNKPSAYYSDPTPPNHAPVSVHPPYLRQLLLDEECSKIAQLPCTRASQHRTLNQSPPHHSSIHILTLIPKLRLSFSLEHLLASHILQPCVEILDLLCGFCELRLIRALNGRRGTNSEVQLEFDPANLRAKEGEAGVGRDVGGCEAYTVLAGICGREGEFAGCAAALGDYAVVIVEDLVDGYEDSHLGE